MTSISPTMSQPIKFMKAIIWKLFFFINDRIFIVEVRIFKLQVGVNQYDGRPTRNQKDIGSLLHRGLHVKNKALVFQNQLFNVVVRLGRHIVPTPPYL